MCRSVVEDPDKVCFAQRFMVIQAHVGLFECRPTGMSLRLDKCPCRSAVEDPDKVCFAQRFMVIQAHVGLFEYRPTGMSRRKGKMPSCRSVVEDPDKVCFAQRFVVNRSCRTLRVPTYGDVSALGQMSL
ncbi:hypothetical protein B9Z51_05770 [Limnohabitans sp. T6-5]|nr:hypothetical protein B9Z51_05770 [Limnohabitans sp. T6-5]